VVEDQQTIRSFLTITIEYLERKMPTNLNIPTRKRLTEQGYLVENVEKYNTFSRKKNDLWGFIDFLAIKRDEVLAIQVTSKSNMSARRKKMTEHENIGKVREAGIRIELWGFYKEKNRWQVKIEDLS
jgi:hypothetical protein